MPTQIKLHMSGAVTHDLVLDQWWTWVTMNLMQETMDQSFLTMISAVKGIAQIIIIDQEAKGAKWILF